MIIFGSRKYCLTLCTLLAIALTAGKWASGQNCGCASNLCCSQYGYCGSTAAYCGTGCRSGPCYGSPSTGGGSGVSGIVTDPFFTGIANGAGAGCPGKGFYTRSVFLNAAGSYPGFASGSNDVARREVAAFFANVAHETGSLCYINERNPSTNYCDPKYSQYPCAAGKAYYGRGPLQLTWNYNYGAAGQSILFDGLNDPDIVARDNLISFKAALWFWMNNCHNAITSGQGFGATIRAINGMECNGGNSPAVNSRVQYYRNYCSQLGVDPGPNISC